MLVSFSDIYTGLNQCNELDEIKLLLLMDLDFVDYR